MARIAIIADDLTGASDTGVQFARKGLRTRVLFEAGELPRTVSAVVIDTDSRAAEAGEARERARQAARLVAEAGFEHVFKKVDSTLRGNLGQEIDGILSELHLDLAVVAPAFPKLGRTTVGGRHYLRGLPLEETEIARDPKCPVRESRIAELLGSQAPGLKSGLIGLDVLRAGPGAAAAALVGLRSTGVQLAICDAEVDTDLAGIAAAVVSSGLRVLWVGSAGLADFLPELLGLVSDQAGPEQALPGGGRPVLLVAGSISPTTRGQVAAVQRQPGVAVIELDPLAVLGTGREAELLRCERILVAAAESGQDLALISGSAPEQVAGAQSLGAALGLDAPAVSGEVAAALGAVAARLVRRCNLAGLVLTGGDTAKAVCQQLGASGMDVLQELEPGVPLSHLTGAVGLPAVTKAGAFGTETTLLRAMQTLKGAEMLCTGP